MYAQVKQVLHSVTFAQSSITLFGTLINAGLGLIFYILLARFLGTSSFGIFSIAIVTLTLISDIANIGTDTGIVNFVGKYIYSEKPKALKFLKLGLEIKLLVSVLVIVLGWFFTPLVARYFFAKEELILPLRLSLIGASTALLFSYATSAIQAIQKFWLWSFVNIGTNFLRLVTILLLFNLKALTVSASMVTYTTIPLLGFLIVLYFLPSFWAVKNEKTVAKEFFNYNKWVALLTLVAALTARLDTFIATRFLTLHDVGIYSVANNLAGVVPQIVLAVAVVAAPKLTSFDTKKKAINFLLKLQLFVFGLCLLGITIGLPIGYLVINYFYSNQYSQSFEPFVILFLAQLIFLFSVPVHASIFYYFAKPSFFVLVSFVQLILLLFFGTFLVSHYGYIGASYAVLLGNVFNLVIPGIWVINKFKK